MVESNRNVQVNWGTFNVPTLLSVLGILWYTATHTAVQDQRLGVIEDNRSSSRIEYVKRFEAIEADVRALNSQVGQVEYKTTTNEANIASANQRMDRFSDAFQDIRQTLGDLSTKFEVVSTKIDNAFPMKKSDMGLITPEYAGK